MSHFLNLTLSRPLCYSLRVTNYGIREKIIFCIYGCFSARYIKGGRKLCLFYADTHACIKNTYWQSSGIITILRKYCIVMSDTLIRLLDVFFLLLTVILSELQEELPSPSYVIFCQMVGGQAHPTHTQNPPSQCLRPWLNRFGLIWIIFKDTSYVLSTRKDNRSKHVIKTFIKKYKTKRK